MPDNDSLIDQLRIAPEQRHSAPGRPAWLKALIGVILPLLIGLGLWWALRTPTVPVQAVQARTEQVSQAARRASVLDASGYVIARRLATVSARVTGKVTDVLVEEGMTVSAGQVLARLDDAVDQAELSLSKARLVSTRSSLREIEVGLQEAQRTLRRQMELQASQLTSQADVDAAQTEVSQLEARLQAQREEVKVAGSNVALREQLLAELTIRAPFDGVVVAKAAQPGEMVSPISAGGGFTRTGICTIVDMDSLEIEVDVNEAYIHRVSDGQPAVAVLDAYPDWEIPAQVIAVVPTADRQKATVRVRIGLLEKDRRVLPEMGVNVRFLEADEPVADSSEQPASRAILVPSSAIQRRDSGSFVFVIDGDMLERRAISLGEQRQNETVITAGLRANETIVADANNSELADGQRVRVMGD